MLTDQGSLMQPCLPGRALEGPVFLDEISTISWWKCLHFPVRRGWCWGKPVPAHVLSIPSLTQIHAA